MPVVPCRNPRHNHRTMWERIDCARRGDRGAPALVGARRKPPAKPLADAAEPEGDEAELEDVVAG